MIMLKNIVHHLLLLLLNNIVPSLTNLVQVFLNKMAVPSKSLDTLNTVRALLIFAALSNDFWREVALTVVYTINHVPFLLQNQSLYCDFIGSYLTMSFLMFLVVHASFLSSLMNIPNNNLEPIFVVSWSMALNIRVIDVMILLLIDFRFLVISSFESIRCLLSCLLFTLSSQVLINYDENRKTCTYFRRKCHVP